jgi:serine/threonine-protein kinase
LTLNTQTLSSTTQEPRASLKLLIADPVSEERGGVLSPDGRWLAYESNRSGQFEIYVRPYPALDRQWSVSSGGGTQPLWSADGHELFYSDSLGGIMRVQVNPSGQDWRPGKPIKLLLGPFYTGGVLGGGVNTIRSYDVSRDGKRFLVLKESAADTGVSRCLFLVQHWDV